MIAASLRLLSADSAHELCSGNLLNAQQKLNDSFVDICWDVAGYKSKRMSEKLFTYVDLEDNPPQCKYFFR